MHIHGKPRIKCTFKWVAMLCKLIIQKSKKCNVSML